MTEPTKTVHIPTSSGIIGDPGWRNDDEEARAKRQRAYEENRIRYEDLIERAKREKAGE